jgi:hypothetical protein
VVKIPFEHSEEETVFILIHQKNFASRYHDGDFFSRSPDGYRDRGCFFHAVPMAIGIADVFFTQITQIDSR